MKTPKTQTELFDYVLSCTSVYKNTLVKAIRNTKEYREFVEKRHMNFLITNKLYEDNDNDPDSFIDFINKDKIRSSK
jgi:hypothetical protein